MQQHTRHILIVQVFHIILVYQFMTKSYLVWPTVSMQMACGQCKLQGVPKVPHTFVFVISLKSLVAQNKKNCKIKKKI
jgi:hypothetical protein